MTCSWAAVTAVTTDWPPTKAAAGMCVAMGGGRWTATCGSEMISVLGSVRCVGGLHLQQPREARSQRFQVQEPAGKHAGGRSGGLTGNVYTEGTTSDKFGSRHTVVDCQAKVLMNTGAFRNRATVPGRQHKTGAALHGSPGYAARASSAPCHLLACPPARSGARRELSMQRS